jgi:hypothetical protein
MIACRSRASHLILRIAEPRGLWFSRPRLRCERYLILIGSHTVESSQIHSINSENALLT